MTTSSQTFSKQELVEMIVNAQEIIRMDDLDDMLRKEMLSKEASEFTSTFKDVMGLGIRYIGSNTYTIVYDNKFTYKSKRHEN